MAMIWREVYVCKKHRRQQGIPYVACQAYINTGTECGKREIPSEMNIFDLFPIRYCQLCLFCSLNGHLNLWLWMIFKIRQV